MRQSVPVPLPGREYSIEIGPGLLAEAGTLLAGRRKPGRVMVVTNPTVARLYLEKLRASLAEAGFTVSCAEVPDGEEYKTLDQAAFLYDRAVQAGLDRSDLIVSLGGGVIGDLAGFVAATYLRGVAFVQIPTTILAQVDSSIGGKVGVNLPVGKNMVGAFHQPLLVLIDPLTLKTLPEREIRSGLIEVLKHGLLEADYFTWYEAHLPGLLALDQADLVEGIAGSCRIKTRIVLADEREQGLRALLNLGHTVGHAVETVSGYGRWRHGEAVGLGLIVAGRLSQRLGLGATEAARLEAAVRATLANQLPWPEKDQVEPILAALYKDKKTLGGRLRLVLLQAIGRVVIDSSTPGEAIRAELAVLTRREAEN